MEVGKSIQWTAKSSSDLLVKYAPVSVTGGQVSELTSIISQIHNIDSHSSLELIPPPAFSENSPMISIVTPCYNQADYLYDTAESILQSSYIHWEWIIVRDGGSEACLHEAKKIQSSNPTRVIRVFDKLNTGLADTRNFAIHRAIGDWICLLDADDTIHYTYLGLVAGVIKDDPRVTAINSNQQFFQESSWRWDLPAFSSHRMRYVGLFPVQTVFRFI
jgi:cellulose synthase/poly-beta-1,6-N-acetylglucosamine synthase-like glycosyltransferase